MSGGNGGGKGFFDEAFNVESLTGKGNFFENAFADIINVGVQGLTGGIAGFENGKISNGVATNAAKKSGAGAVSGIKEVTGAKAAENANELARQQFEQAQSDALAARAEAQDQVAKSELQKSQIAGAARNAQAPTRSNFRGVPSGGTLLGQDEKDFLGI